MHVGRRSLTPLPVLRTGLLFPANRIYVVANPLDLRSRGNAEQVYPQLVPETQALYRLLLEEQDQDLFAWFLQRRQPPSPELKAIVDIVLSHAGEKRA